jgi:hypothetical protein
MTSLPELDDMMYCMNAQESSFLWCNISDLYNTCVMYVFPLSFVLELNLCYHGSLAEGF